MSRFLWCERTLLEGEELDKWLKANESSWPVCSKWKTNKFWSFQLHFALEKLKNTPAVFKKGKGDNPSCINHLFPFFQIIKETPVPNLVNQAEKA